ncbi:hypothetical protein CU097_010757 [Rhizopus azygosporus]|uniref:Uncharacterized protein n=1 Tax=Rhizopus azygosporus TaxID=86630 RepID=A0A367K6W1_RHIAZ|nr:hypothetical protein CU097_010757 [Rhizopus azygosporus]
MDGYEKDESEKPGLMLSITDRKRKLYFYVELKRPECQSIYQKEDDFCKLLKQMKVPVDKQVKLKLVNPASCGLLCEGFNSSLYKMTLVEDGIYLPIMVKRFSLIENESQLLNAATIIEALGLVLDELQSLQKRYKGKRKKEAKKSPFTISDNSYTNL